MIILPSLLINSAYNGIKILCMNKIPSKHTSKCLQTIKSRANPKHILNKWLLNYMSLDLFSHFAKSLIFRFSFSLQAQPFFPRNFYQLLTLSLVLWRNRLSWCFHAFTEINSHSLFFSALQPAWILRNGSNLFVFLSLSTRSHVFQPRKDTAFWKCFIFLFN